MQITIEIPKDFEEHFNKDRFKDSLNRLRADAGTFCMAGLYEIELCDMLVQAFADAEIRSDKACNSFHIPKDMTTGDFINAMSDALIEKICDDVIEELNKRN